MQNQALISAGDPAIFDSERARSDALEGEWVAAMLDLEHATGERVGIIAVEHRHDALDQDRAVVKLRADQMHGAAVDAHTCGKGPLMRVQTLEGRQQRGVDVKQPVLPALHEPWG